MRGTMPLPNLPAVVEILASLVMLVSVVGAFWSLRITHSKGKTPIGPRHIQFVSVCLIVPTILILGLEKVLSSETSATLIGGLAGYLLSGIGKYEPPKLKEPPTGPPPPDKKGNGKPMTAREEAQKRYGIATSSPEEGAEEGTSV